MTAHTDEINEFYRLIEQHRVRLAGGRLLGQTSGRDGWPQRGVYLLFDPLEVRSDGVTPRVVRVGTHALTDGFRSTLWGRLRQHRGTTGGQSPGGGNHRGSVFRLHVGTALLSDPAWPEAVRRTWAVGATADAAVRAGEAALEQAVSAYLGTMTVLWIAVDDSPGPDSERRLIERGAISLLSNARSIDPPSSGWLGHRSPKPAIRTSGLWNVEHVADAPEPRFIEVLSRRMAETPPVHLTSSFPARDNVATKPV